MPKRTIRKTAAHLYCSSSRGWFSSNLYADNIFLKTADQWDDSTCSLSLDLSRNLRSKNQEENGVYDAKEIQQEQSSLLNLVEVHDDMVVKEFTNFCKQHSPKEWVLELNFGHGDPLEYQISSMKVDHGGLILNLSGLIDG